MTILTEAFSVSPHENSEGGRELIRWKVIIIPGWVNQQWTPSRTEDLILSGSPFND